MSADGRTCIKCKEWKRFSEFHRNRRTSSGFNNVCKICKNIASKARYQQQGERLRAIMAEQRRCDYEHRIAIERASRQRRKEAQRPSKNERQQVRNRLLTGSKFLVTRKELEALYARPCFHCGAIGASTIDHVVPLSRGGNHSIGNLMTLCGPCNASKGNKFLSEWRRNKMKAEAA